MKKNRLGILQIMAITVASIMLISGAAFGASAAELEKDITNQSIPFTDNYAEPGENGGALYFEGIDRPDQIIPFTDNDGILDGNGGAIFPTGNHRPDWIIPFNNNDGILNGNGGAIFPTGNRMPTDNITFIECCAP